MLCVIEEAVCDGGDLRLERFEVRRLRVGRSEVDGQGEVGEVAHRGSGKRSKRRGQVRCLRDEDFIPRMEHASVMAIVSQRSRADLRRERNGRLGELDDELALAVENVVDDVFAAAGYQCEIRDMWSFFEHCRWVIG